MDVLVSDCKCAPSIKCRPGCYDKYTLKKFAKAINKKIKDKKKRIKTNTTRDKLYKSVSDYFKPKCKNDPRKWLKQPEIKHLVDDKLKYYTFRPKMPKEWKNNKYTWLNSLDILHTMIQAEKVYPNFKFYGPVPSDCPVGVNCELSKINLNKLNKKNKSKIGIIYNLDVSTGPGTHWTAVYIDMNTNEINYYDSYGEEPIPYIKQFLINMYRKMEKINSNPIIIYNDKRHQYGFSECGVYSMYFLFNRLTGKNMYDISKQTITDKKMNDMRKKLFI